MANIIDKVLEIKAFYREIFGLDKSKSNGMLRVVLGQKKTQSIKIEFFLEVPSGFEPL